MNEISQGGTQPIHKTVGFGDTQWSGGPWLLRISGVKRGWITYNFSLLGLTVLRHLKIHLSARCSIKVILILSL